MSQSEGPLSTRVSRARRAHRSSLALMLLLALGVTGVAGCVGIETTPSRASLVGVWHVEDAFGQEDLTLRADGTYSQRAIDVVGRRRDNAGTWEYLPNGEGGTRQPHVTLRHALVHDDFAKLPQGASDSARWMIEDWVLWTVSDWGVPGLSWHPDAPSFQKR